MKVQRTVLVNVGQNTRDINGKYINVKKNINNEGIIENSTCKCKIKYKGY